MAKIKISGNKAVINGIIFKAKCEEHASQMKTNAIRKAPEDTENLKKRGIKKESFSNGAKVYLDTKNAYYGPYQELGWNQNGYHPGRFFMEKAFLLECAKGEIDAKSLMKEALTITSSNGYDIVEYRRINGKTVKGAYKK